MNKELDDLALVYKNLKPIPRSIDEAFKTPAYACAVTIFEKRPTRFFNGSVGWICNLVLLVALIGTAIYTY